MPSFFNTPDICRVDHCSSMMGCLILHTNSGARATLRVERLRRSIALSCALNQIYLPDGVLLRFNSRESVDWLIPTIRAISFLGHFLCSKAKICDLCSEVSCLYIRNTKIINLRESSKGDSFFVLPVSLFGATRPGREANPRCFSWIRSYEKTNDLLHFDFESTPCFHCLRLVVAFLPLLVPFCIVEGRFPFLCWHEPPGGSPASSAIRKRFPLVLPHGEDEGKRTIL